MKSIIPQMICGILQRSHLAKSRLRPPNGPIQNLRLCNARACSTLVKDKKMALLDGKIDRHKGIHIHLSDLDTTISSDEFSDKLQASMPEWKRRGILAAWLNVPITMSALIPIAAHYGFTFHHAEGNTASLCRWLDEARHSAVPRFASHQVGVAGCVLDEATKQVLMVQDKSRPVSQSKHFWKFPGGVSELDEDICETARREVFEETGLETEFQGILGFRQQHKMPNAFGRSDLFFICHMKPVSFDLHPDYDNEIDQCQWMSVSTVLDNPDTSAITHTICKLLQHGFNHGFSTIHFGSETLKSLYLGLPFQMYYPKVLRDKK